MQRRSSLAKASRSKNNQKTNTTRIVGPYWPHLEIQRPTDMTRKVCPYTVNPSHAGPKAMFWPCPLGRDRRLRKPLVGSFEGSKQLRIPMPRRGMGDLHESIVAWRSGMMNTTVQFRSGEGLQYTRYTLTVMPLAGHRVRGKDQRSQFQYSQIRTPSAARKSKKQKAKENTNWN